MHTSSIRASVGAIAKIRRPRTNASATIAAIPALRESTALPVLADPSHAAGVSDYVRPLARAAVAAGADGLLVEVHPDPAKACSDREQQITPDAFDAMTCDRPYRPALTRERVCAELRHAAGEQFDPNLAKEFLTIVETGICEVDPEFVADALAGALWPPPAISAA